MAKRKGGSKKSSKSSGNVKILLLFLYICALPFVITYFVLKSEKLSKNTKIGIVSAIWIMASVMFIVASVSNKAENERLLDPTYNIQSLTMNNSDDLTVKIGETYSKGKVTVKVKAKDNFSVDDIVFVSENPNVATINFKEESMSYLSFDIVGIEAGETYVYAMIKDSDIKSESIHIIVPEPIRIQKIELNSDKTEIVLKECINIDIEITPENAEDKAIEWISSDESVATVGSDGVVSAVSGGSVTITAKSNNGVESSIDMSVDDSKTLMNLNVTHPKKEEENIGDEWRYDIKMNDERTPKTIGLSVGEKLTFSATVTEEDDNPDVGTAKTTHTVTQEDIDNGFVVTMDVKVTENGGRYKGKSAIITVTYTFSAN